MKIGRTRIKLAEMLNKLFPDLMVRPEDLQVQPPAYAVMDCVRWWAYVDYQLNSQMKCHIYSWDRMGEIVKKGIAVVSREYGDIEVCSKD